MLGKYCFFTTAFWVTSLWPVSQHMWTVFYFIIIRLESSPDQLIHTTRLQPRSEDWTDKLGSCLVPRWGWRKAASWRLDDSIFQHTNVMTKAPPPPALSQIQQSFSLISTLHPGFQPLFSSELVCFLALLKIHFYNKSICQAAWNTQV